MGFAYDGRNRLETGIDGFLELRDPQTGQTLANWIGVQVKTTDTASYPYEDDNSFEYLVKPIDLEYWRGSNIPVIIVLVRLSDSSIFWKPLDSASAREPRRLRFDKMQDRFDKAAADNIAALCVPSDRLGTYVPPMQSGEAVHLTMVRVLLPDKIFVGASLFGSGREAARELASLDPHAPFDWVVRNRQFLSFRDPRGSSLAKIVDEGSVEAVESDSLALVDDLDDEYVFIDLLGRTLSVQLEDDLTYDRDSRALYFRAPRQNRGCKYYYRSLVNETSARVVTVWRGKDGRVGSVRHHAFLPRFQRIGDEWLLSITPTFVFTRDGFRPHYNSGALLSGKKKKENNGAIRGQFMMWRHLLVNSGRDPNDLLFGRSQRKPLLHFEALDSIAMPLAVPEEAWQREDPSANKFCDTDWLL